MNCYYHQTVPAVGICKHCQRGVCPNCLTIIEDSVACRGSCEEKVVAVHRLLSQAPRTNRVVRLAYRRNMIAYFLLGAFILMPAGFAIYNRAEYFGLIGVFLAGAVFLSAYSSYRNWRAFTESPEDVPNRFSNHVPNSPLPPADPNHPFESPHFPIKNQQTH